MLTAHTSGHEDGHVCQDLAMEQRALARRLIVDGTGAATVKLIARLFKGRSNAASLEREADKALVDQIVRRYSAGNVCLQSGWYATESDIKEMRRQVMAHNFRKDAAR